MIRILHLVALGSAAGLAGCGGAIVSFADSQSVPRTAEVKSHVLVGTTGSDGKLASVTDRTSTGINTKGTLNIYKDDFPTSASLEFNGTADGGAGIPNSGRMLLEGALVTRAMNGEELKPEEIVFREGDSFLQVVTSGSGFTVGRYQTRAGSNAYVGYVTAGEQTPVASLPTGTAVYKGGAEATVVGSATGSRIARGNSEVTAAFAPGGGAVTGTLSGLTINGAATGYDVTMAGAIVGNTYSGTAALAGAPGAVVTSGNVQGAFYGASGQGTGGSFYLKADNVNAENIEMIGGFGGTR